jgi:hypothetical protein
MLFIDPAKVRYADYEGHHVRNRGPLTIPRCPQRRPISPVMWEEFARMLTPELQRRGLLRAECTDGTMRENFAQLSGTSRGGEGGASLDRR